MEDEKVLQLMRERIQSYTGVMISKDSAFELFKDLQTLGEKFK
jgi:hypothetical protein